MDGGACGPNYNKSTDVLRNLYEYPDRNVNVEMLKRLKSKFVILIVCIHGRITPNMSEYFSVAKRGQFSMRSTILERRRGS